MKPIEEIDCGKRIKERIGSEVYYKYVPDKGTNGNMITCPRENSPDPKHRLDILGVVEKENSDYEDRGYK